MSLLMIYFLNSALFVQLMDQTETWYLQLPVKGLPERNKVSIHVSVKTVGLFISLLR